MLYNARGLHVVVVLAVGVVLWCGDVSIAAVQFAPGVPVGAVACPEITEASGLAASRQNADVLWVHNDSGGLPRVFAMNVQGQHLGIYDVAGASSVDWEDMTIGPGPVGGQDYLYLGDIGDNSAVRPIINVYRVAEPTVDSSQPPVMAILPGVETFTLMYPDGPRDAETLMVDPVTGDLYVVTKREALSRVYVADGAQLVNGAVITMDFKCELPWPGATGGDISPDGDEIIIRSYLWASLWERPGAGDLWDAFAGAGTAIPLAAEPQGETIAFDGAGLGYYTVSEGLGQPIYYYARVPEPATLLMLVVGIAGLIRRR